MKKDLFKSFSLLFLLAILSIILVTTINYYRHYKEMQEKRLVELLDYFTNLSEEELPEELKKGRKAFTGVRFTLLDEAGKVLYDTDNEAEEMESHVDRKEIREALEKDFGEDVRKSETLNENFYYMAKKLPTNHILRVSERQRDLFSSFKPSIYPLVLTLIIGLVITFFFIDNTSDYMVRSLEDQFNSLLSGKKLEKEYAEIYPVKRLVEDQQEELKKQVTSLNEYKETMEIIFKNMSNGFIFLNEKDEIELMNDRAIFLLGKKKEENFFGFSIFSLLRGEEFIEILEEETDSNLSLKEEINGRELLFILNPVYSKKKYLGKIMMIRDITEETILERERRKFTSNVTHELKTPLTSINGYAELLKNNLVKEEDLSKVGKTILNSGNHLLNLVEKMLSLSKLEEKEESPKEEIRVDNLILKIQKTLEGKAKQSKIEVVSSLDEITYFGVREVLEAVIFNLIDNGIKYGKENGHLEIFLKEKERGFQFFVKDDGIGIPEEELEKIFQRFYMTDKSRNRPDATGLGLAIVKHGVEFMNGQMDIESSLGEGTIFEMNIPYNS